MNISENKHFIQPNRIQSELFMFDDGGIRRCVQQYYAAEKLSTHTHTCQRIVALFPSTLVLEQNAHGPGTQTHIQ